MEKENNMHGDHKMCDWCGNETGHKYRWMRLILAIVIALFIFSAGYHLGELNVLVHSQYGSQMMDDTSYHGSRMMWNRDGMMDNQAGYTGTTTIVVPATPAVPTPAATAPAAPAKQ